MNENRSFECKQLVRWKAWNAKDADFACVSTAMHVGSEKKTHWKTGNPTSIQSRVDFKWTIKKMNINEKYVVFRRKIESGLINDLLPILVLFSVIGARAYYVTFEFRDYQHNWLENKILHSEISKLKSNSRLKKEALKNNMKFPKKEDIKILIYE